MSPVIGPFYPRESPPAGFEGAGVVCASCLYYRLITNLQYYLEISLHRVTLCSRCQVRHLLL